MSQKFYIVKNKIEELQTKATLNQITGLIKCKNIDVSKPDWPDRDRFVLSAGHGSMLIYSLNYLLGYSDMNIESLKNFRQLKSNTPGHPEYGDTLGVETTTGPLGQGLGTAVGMALAERMSNAKFGKNLVDHFTYVIVGDGCLQEGISHESIEFAGHLKLAKLVVIWDDNSISIDGSTNLANSSNPVSYTHLTLPTSDLV